MSSVVEFNEENFESDVLASTVPVLVEFGATWCGPCQKQLPILQKFAEENENVKVGKVDIDQSRILANQYAVRSVPTIILFKDGKKITSKVGLADEKKILSMLSE